MNHMGTCRKALFAAEEREDLFGPLHDDPRWAPFLAERRARAASYREELRWPIDTPGWAP